MNRRALLACLLFAVSARLDAQTVEVRDPGPGPAGRILRSALDAPHRLFLPGTGRLVLARDSTFATTVIVLGRDVAVEGRVHGDVIVVDGNLFMHPGAQLDGRAIAIGGGAYPSMLARVRGGLQSFFDVGFTIGREGSLYLLDYQQLRRYAAPPALTLPGAFGLRVPTYDRTDGLSQAFAPLLSLDTGRVELEPTVTYRSQLGTIDPSVSARLQASRRVSYSAFAGRGTFTNDGWITSDLANSAEVVGIGADTRNYFRADRVELEVHRLWETLTTEIEPFLGLRTESARSVRPDTGAPSGPWSFFNRSSVKGMLRPNPRVNDGRITSILVGGRVDWQSQGVQTTIDLAGEGALRAPGGTHFTQANVNAQVAFPTFGSQRFSVDGHLVLTGGTAPRQRWSYLGGSGTFPMLELLSRGGDQLLFIESNYDIPLDRVDVPFLGVPTFTLRDVLGAAGPSHLPPLEQNIAFRVALSYLRGELLIDPARRKAELGFGLSLLR